MVRTAKTPATPAPAVENVVVAAPAAAAPAKKAAGRKSKAAAEPAAAPATDNSVVATEPVADVVVDGSSASAKILEFSAKLQQLFGLFSSIKTEFKTLEKAISRELKAAQKSSGKKQKKSGNRQPSGFVKPTRISDELAGFLGKAAGTEMARTEVSKEINAYIRQNNLQDSKNGRVIKPDSKLSQLLNISAADELTYFNLQRYMKHHFVKAPVATA